MNAPEFVIKCSSHPLHPSKAWTITVNSRTGLLLAMQAGMVVWWRDQRSFSLPSNRTGEELKAFFDAVAIEYEEN